MTTICIKAIVSGKVQGVFFRDSARKKALELQLTGWVKNTMDGNVELVACGEQDHIIEFSDWLWQGSDASEVSNVYWQETELQTFDDFTVQH